MDDLISRQAAVDAVIKLVQEAECRYPKHMAIPEFVYQGVVSIRELPSAERRGRWKCVSIGRYGCSLCGHEPYYVKDLHYCPNCGARMDGEEK